MINQCTEVVRLPFSNSISGQYSIRACPPDETCGGGRHTFYVETINEAGEIDYVTVVKFQHGALPQTPHNGLLSTVVLQILIEHLKSFQEGPFAEPNTDKAIQHLQEAYFWLAARSDERNARGVLGKHLK